jgi:anaerobic selenocysteine-containing dehydrogenase
VGAAALVRRDSAGPTTGSGWSNVERRIDRIAEPWGSRTPHGPGDDWPVRVDMHLQQGADPDAVDWVETASILHSNGDALEIAVRDGRMVGVRGIGRSRVNRGRLGPKDLYGWQANGSRDRLTRPLVRRGGELVEASWDEAMELIAERSRALLQDPGPSSLGFYTTGQLFLEEYYTQAVIARAGLGTNHMDGNTRMCTSTAAEALKESFGCDGQPGSYADVDHADVIVCWGHNVAETQAVLWMRMLDRLDGPQPPKLVCIDPRPTPVARRADVHLAPRPGTNLALLNAIVAQLIANGWVDEAYVARHAVGFEELEERTRSCTPEWAARICDVDAGAIREAAQLIGSARRLLQTVLQGVYQSHQATAAACQVNNVAILRGMLGRPGCGVLQMNGQPTAQNTRETGANGDLPGFRNWDNDAHVADLARVWNVEPLQIPHWGPSTHAMEMFRHVEEGSIRFLWVTATNPAASLPELRRIRSVLERDSLFLVVQDIFPTETTSLADVVLPAATWGEKTGTFTNADRTVHVSEKAVEPPGEARSDLDILLDYARRMDFRDKDGAPLVKWHDPESAFEAWKACSEGRPCDYHGITYARLRETAGLQWGGERLYEDGRFFAAPEECETYGRDLLTGAALEETEYRALNPDGKAVLKAAEYVPPHALPSEEHPLLLTTGRTLYHFHTRTKTARAPQLQAAAPDVWVELSPADAARRGLAEGDLAEVRSPRGSVRARVRLTGIRPGLAFVPFHYGYWDHPGRHDRAANELTITEWDPVSKQPLFKIGAVEVEKLAGQERSSAPAPTTAAARPIAGTVPETRGGESALVVEVVEP